MGHMMAILAKSVRGFPVCDRRLLIRGTRYTAIPIISLDGLHDVYLTERTVDEDKFCDFIRVPILMPLNFTNPHSAVIMDNASIHHVEEVYDLIKTQSCVSFLHTRWI